MIHAGAAVDTITLAGIPTSLLSLGYRIEWVKSTTADRRLAFVPNGLSTAQRSLWTQGDAGGGSGDISVAYLLAANGDRGVASVYEGTISLRTGIQRMVEATGGCGSDEVNPAQNRNIFLYGFWKDDATPITSIDVVCLNSIGAPVADILAGTLIELYRKD